MRFRLTFLLLGLAAVSACETLEPEEAQVRNTIDSYLRFSARKELTSADARALTVGAEMESWKWPSIGHLKGPDTVRFTAKGMAVARMLLTGGEGYKKDVYLHMKKVAEVWRIAGIKSLTGTAAAETLIREYSASHYTAAGDNGNAARTPRAVYSARFALMLDSELKTWFGQHREQLDQLVTTAGEDGADGSEDDGEETTTSPAKLLLTALHVASVESAVDGMEVTLWSNSDSAVLFLYNATGECPEMNTAEIIWSERLAPGWCLVRTT